MEKQNLYTEEELAKVTDEAERKHLIECAQDQSKIDMYEVHGDEGQDWGRTYKYFVHSYREDDISHSHYR